MSYKIRETVDQLVCDSVASQFASHVIGHMIVIDAVVPVV